jgi:RNA polymerase sigma-70 factor (ECF subfamily)
MKREASRVSSQDKANDLDGFQTDLVALLPRLRRFARALTRDADAADDLVQVAVERGLARRGQWKPDTNLASWMFTLMKNAWIDEARARRRRSAMQRPAAEGERVADPAVSDPQSRTAVEQALMALPADQRLAVVLVLVEGLSYAEASAVIGVPAGTLTSRLVRGRMALAARLGIGGGE